jgi:hypothetical protein
MAFIASLSALGAHATHGTPQVDGRPVAGLFDGGVQIPREIGGEPEVILTQKGGVRRKANQVAAFPVLLLEECELQIRVHIRLPGAVTDKGPRIDPPMSQSRRKHGTVCLNSGLGETVDQPLGHFGIVGAGEAARQETRGEGPGPAMGVTGGKKKAIPGKMNPVLYRFSNRGGNRVGNQQHIRTFFSSHYSHAAPTH